MVNAADVGCEAYFKYMETAMKQQGIEQGLRPLVFGEVLYDSFPDGSMVLGGAPFNVAWHLQGFGLEPLFVSRVGDDALGERILAAMTDWGMDIRGVQRDADHPTGRVVVSIHNNEPSFEIVPEQAYDFIDGKPLQALLDRERYSLAYHGSLIARHPSASATLDKLRQTDLPLFVDVNLRDPWWRREWLDDALRRACWVKLNEHELRMLSPGEANADVNTQAESMLRDYGLEWLVVTRGGKGALVLADGEMVETSPGRVDGLVDTVGAGDAFSAVTILGLLRGWPPPALAQRAVDFAAAVCRMRGAIGRDRALYERYLRKWTE